MPTIYGTYPIGRYHPRYPESYVNNNTPLVQAPVLVEELTLVESVTLFSAATLVAPVLQLSDSLAAPAAGLFVEAGVLVDVSTAATPTSLIASLPGVLVDTSTALAPTIANILQASVLNATDTLAEVSPIVSVSAGVLDDNPAMAAPAIGQYVEAGVLRATDILAAGGFTISVEAGVLVDTSIAAAPTVGVSVEAPSLTDIVTALVATITGADSTTYTVYALNADTGAPSQYTNFAFSGGFADMGDGTLYALDADNLYTISGSTDASDTIKARIRTGAFAIVEGAQARLDSVDALMDSDGEMICKVTAESGDEFAEYWYNPHLKTGGVLQERTYKVNQGIKSRYFMVELASTNGAAGEFNHMNLYPIPIRRRRSE